MANKEVIALEAGLPVKFDIYASHNRLIPSHWHNHLEVLYICQGAMQIICHNERYALEKNDLFIINSGDIHLTRSLGSVEVICLLIPYELIDKIPGYTAIRFREYFRHDELHDDPEFMNMIQHLIALRTLYEQSEDGFQFLFFSSLYLFLHALFRNYAFQPSIENHKYAKQLSPFKDLINYVEANYRQAISLKEAASFVALNPEYFCRSFKRITGFTFMEYVNMVRLTHIHRDILDTDDSITAIQERHGFTNYKIFNRMFKETYGCTPSKLKSSKG